MLLSSTKLTNAGISAQLCGALIKEKVFNCWKCWWVLLVNRKDVQTRLYIKKYSSTVGEKFRKSVLKPKVFLSRDTKDIKYRVMKVYVATISENFRPKHHGKVQSDHFARRHKVITDSRGARSFENNSKHPLWICITRAPRRSMGLIFKTMPKYSVKIALVFWYIINPW